jgi:hypothetical protein
MTSTKTIIHTLTLCGLLFGLTGCGGKEAPAEVPKNPLPLPPKDALITNPASGGRGGEGMTPVK